MMNIHYISLTDEQWASIKTNVLSKREGFYEEIAKMLIEKRKNTNVEVIFPTSLSVTERYIIHTYASKGSLTCISFGEGINRHLISTFDKKLVSTIYDTYKQKEIELTPLEKFKNEMFEKIMKVVKESFEQQFQNYIESI